MSSKTEKVAVAAIVIFALVVVAAYIAAFHREPISVDPAQWGQLGDYLGGTLNPFFGLLTSLFAFFAFKTTQESLNISRNTAEHAQLSITLESFYKIYNSKLNDLVFYIDNDEFNGKEALNQSLKYIKLLNKNSTKFARKMELNTENSDSFIFEKVSDSIQNIRLLCMSIEPLYKNLTHDRIKKDFVVIAAQYIDKELILAMELLSKPTVKENLKNTNFENFIDTITTAHTILFSKKTP